MKKMVWEDKSSTADECVCQLETLVSAGKMKLQQNLPSDRQIRADIINGNHANIQAKRSMLQEHLDVYMEAHNKVEEKKADLIATASAPPMLSMEGKPSGWDKLASDSAAKRTKHALGLVEVSVNGQIEHASNMLDRVIAYEKLHKDAHGESTNAASSHTDFAEAVAHHKHLGEKDISHLKTSIQEHIAHNKRFLSRIGNANRAIARGMTASI